MSVLLRVWMQIQRRDETGNEKDTNFQIIENERSY